MDFSRFFTSSVDTSLALPASHDPVLVVASYLVAALAGFAFLRFAARIGELSESVLRFAWMTAGAVTMGLGVWAMHFIAMLAYRLPIPVNYDPLITTISVLPAMIGSAIALHAVASPHVSLLRLAGGAVALGAGIGAMHYTGMAALHFDAFVSYDPILFATSIIVAVALAFAALFTTLWSLKRNDARLISFRETAGALFLGLAVSGMHYTAMTSAYCIADPDLHDSAGIESQTFAAMTAIVAVLVLGTAIAGILFDRRLRIEIARREEVQAELVQAQKMEALGNLAGGIAHEFNNALLPIVALTELTLDDLPEDHDGRENLSSVLDAARHAKYLVNQVMIFTRQNDQELTKIDLGSAVERGVTHIKAGLPPTVTLIADIDPGAGTALANRSQTETILQNLASNAVDALAGEPGEIRISLRRCDAGAGARGLPATLDPKRGYAVLSVSDTGRGMDAETLAKIFNPFFTTKPVGKGTGLGLAMVDGIIRRFDGRVDTRSEPGAGTTIDIYLPLLVPSSEQPVAQAA